MSNTDQAAAKPAVVGMRDEIHAKWDKFSTIEIAALKDNDDLIAKVQSKYSLDAAKAKSDVMSFAKGRSL